MGTVRVIAGSAKGRKLTVPRVRGLRPTLNRIREPLFDVLGESLNGAHVVDLYAGSGALGIESLSRGAARAVFVDSHPLCINAIGENLQRCGFLDSGHVVRGTVPGVFGRMGHLVPPKFDTVFMDPPYGSAERTPLLRKLHHFALLGENARIVLEHFHKDVLPCVPAEFSLREQRRYGDTVLTFFDYQPKKREHPHD